MTSRAITIFCVLLLLAGCAGGTRWQQAPDTHIVRPGETLFAIGWRYNKDPADIARWNRLGDGSLIYPGQELRLAPPGGSGARTTGRSQPASTSPPKPLPKVPAEPAPDWAWPTNGRVDVAFGSKPGTGTGVLINGRRGQPIVAAAAGRVVYAGDGLIGYGKLIILKHSDTYLSAYGYNDRLLVREGQQIASGERIATMGEGPERKARLHFEIRRNGQPVDPGRQLPRR
ncbi:MAG: peptidoglycan DD-metalloendopeptidase family protein [Gammaproteobacteria bacterium]|nr:peptidoglycan DD-metalloendopeptidase family protein [Gammaproteobacteria bacterium]